MVQRMDVARVPVEQVEPGMSLVVEDGGHSVKFNVQERGFSHTPGQPARLTLTSEPLEDGKPWILEYPVGTIVEVIVRLYDDGVEP